ncbi:MAG: hypothetical protein ACE5LU_11620 [Anaerolineae bacterium]
MGEDYVRYQSSQPQIPCTFLYPADWKVREIVEDGYVEIFIAGPRNKAGTYSISFSVGVTRPADQTPTEAATSLLAKFRSPYSSEELGPISTTVAGRSATAMEVVYSMPLPLNSIQPEWTSIREHRIFFQRGDQLYELDYSAPEEDYKNWLEAFHTLVESFAFPEKPADAAPYPSVETTAPQHVREEPAEYEAKESQGDGESEHHQR